MAAKAAQLAQWLKELQDKVNADGNIKYDDILLFTKEKSLTSKQLDSVFKALHEGGVEIIYEEDGKDEFRDGESEEEFEDELLEDGDAEADVDEKEWEKGDGDISADPAGITDPVRLYLRECGTTPLLTSEQEMKLAQTIELEKCLKLLMNKNGWRQKRKRKWPMLIFDLSCLLRKNIPAGECLSLI